MKKIRLAIALAFVLGMIGTAFATTNGVAGPSSPALTPPVSGIVPVIPPTPPPPPPPPSK